MEGISARSVAAANAGGIEGVRLFRIAGVCRLYAWHIIERHTSHIRLFYIGFEWTIFCTDILSTQTYSNSILTFRCFDQIR